MKKLLAFVITAMMMVSLCACSSKTDNDTLTDYDTLEDAEKAAGFSFNFKDVINCGSYYAKEYKAKEGMIEVTYYTEGGSEEEDQFVIRQATLTDEDISDDDTEYSHDFTDSDAGVDEVRLRGTKDTLAVCSFNYDDYSYVLYPGDGDYNETFTVISELTGVDPTTYTSSKDQENEEEEPTEGAPVVEDGRKIDEKAVDALDIAGAYEGETYKVELSMYTDTDEDSVALGTITVNKDDKTVYEGEIQELSTNYYGMMKKDVTFTVYTEDDKLCFDLYIDGAHVDYLTMTEHYVS